MDKQRKLGHRHEVKYRRHCYASSGELSALADQKGRFEGFSLQYQTASIGTSPLSISTIVCWVVSNKFFRKNFRITAAEYNNY
jgi:hypothetical protein